MKNKLQSMVMLVIFLSTASCASIKSIENSEDTKLNGLSYFMPKKDILISITTKKDKSKSVSIGVSPSYPDLSQQYVLQHGTNILSKNTVKIGVNSNGLLSATNTKTVSGVGGALENLAAIAGSAGVLSSLESEVNVADCSGVGVHTFILKNLTGNETICGFTVTSSRVDGDTQTRGHAMESSKSQPGVYYRTNEPYLVKVASKNTNVQAIVFSPSGSRTMFLPVAKTFFADNTADLAFVDGVPTKYDQEIDGEVSALLKLPARIIQAYFAAIGSVFDNFKKNDSSEKAALEESLSLALTKSKYEACLKAVADDDKEQIKELGC